MSADSARAVFWLGFFWIFFALITSSVLAACGGLKRPWVIVIACWLWPITWIILLLLAPLAIHRRESSNK